MPRKPLLSPPPAESADSPTPAAAPRRLGRRANPSPDATAASPAPPVAPKPVASPRRSSRVAEFPAPATEPPASREVEIEGLEAPVVLRARASSTPKASAAPSKPKPAPVLDPAELEAMGIAGLTFREVTAPARMRRSAEEDEPSGIETREPRRRERAERPVPAGDPIEPTHLPGEAPKPVKPPTKPLIPTPPDAPQVIVRGGRAILVHGGEAISPLALDLGLARAPRREVVLESVAKAAEAGVHLFVSGFEFSGDPSSAAQEAEEIAEAARALRSADPKSRLIARLELRAPRGWDARFPDAAYAARDGKLAAPSIADDRYWSAVRDATATVAARLAQAEGVIGVQIDRDGWTLEGGYDSSPAVHVAFRRWLRARYMDDEVMLRAAWFDGRATFDSAEAITRAIPRREGEVRLIRRDRHERRAVDTGLFLSDQTVARIADLAYAAKEASGGRLVVGTRYGATLEDPSPARGQLSLGKLLRTPEVDLISLPATASGAPATAVDSIALNGKLFLVEGDYRTSLGAEVGDRAVVRSPQELENLHLRDLGGAQVHGGGAIWTDRDGRGALDTASVWRRAAAVREALDLPLAGASADPDVALFLDERALAYVDDAAAFGMVVRGFRDAAFAAGVSVGCYLLSDLAHRERLPESRVCLFVNAWDVRAELRSAIKTRLQRDGKVLLWAYAAGLFDGGRPAMERVRDVTGIALRPQPFASRSGTVVTERRHSIAASFPAEFQAWERVEPSYSAIPEDGLVLGEYVGTGLPSFVARRIGADDGTEWTSVFLGDPVATPGLVRALVEMANGHVWGYGDDAIEVRPPFLTLHARGNGPRALTLPLRWSAYDLGAGEWAPTDGATLRITLNDGAVARFLVGPRDEIESLRKSDLAQARRVEEIPPRESNERVDVSSFEVPIVRLDAYGAELAEEGELADEWFLRPVAAATLPEAAAPVADEHEGSRRTGRRRRRGGRDREDERPRGGAPGYSEPVEARGAAEELLNMNVVFRSRA